MLCLFIFLLFLLLNYTDHLQEMIVITHVWEGLEAGSSEIVVPSREYRGMRAQFEASLKACFHFDSYKF